MWLSFWKTLESQGDASLEDDEFSEFLALGGIKPAVTVIQFSAVSCVAALLNRC